MNNLIAGLTQNEVVAVPPNGVKLAEWKPGGPTMALLTQGLNSCTAVGIISTKAGILAHIAPFADEDIHLLNAPEPVDIGARNLAAKLDQVVDLYNRYRHLFPETRSFILAALDATTITNPDAVALCRHTLGSLRLPLTIDGYQRLPPSVGRPLGWTWVVIKVERFGEMPRVYVNLSLWL